MSPPLYVDRKSETGYLGSRENSYLCGLCGRWVRVPFRHARAQHLRNGEARFDETAKGPAWRRWFVVEVPE